jgi:hypothetical protein
MVFAHPSSIIINYHPYPRYRTLSSLISACPRDQDAGDASPARKNTLAASPPLPILLSPQTTACIASNIEERHRDTESIWQEATRARS